VFPIRLNLADAILAVIVIVVGGVVLYIALGYRPGTTAQMGPGYLPRAMGVILLGLGGILLMRSLRAVGDSLPVFELRSVVFVTLGVLSFAFLVRRVGFVPAVMAATILSSFANPNIKLLHTLLLSVGLAAMTSAIFVWGLKISAVYFRWPTF